MTRYDSASFWRAASPRIPKNTTAATLGRFRSWSTPSTLTFGGGAGDAVDTGGGGGSSYTPDGSGRQGAVRAGDGEVDV